MIDCSVEPKESGEVNQCGVKLRPQDDAYKAAYVKIATVCTIGIAVLFLYIFYEKGFMGTQVIPTAAVLFFSIWVIVNQMYYSTIEQNQILPKIDPVHYNDKKKPTINIVNGVIGGVGFILVVIALIAYGVGRKNSDVDGTSLPQNIFEIGGLLVVGISTIPIVLSTINYNIENNIIIPEIWESNGISKLRGKDIPNTRRVHYNMLLIKGIVQSVLISLVFVIILMFVVLKPFGDDYQKKYFVLAIATSIISYIQTFIIHSERVTLLNTIESDISTQKIFTESEAGSNIISGITSAQNKAEEASNKVSSLYDPVIKGVEEGLEEAGGMARQGVDAARGSLSSGGGGTEGFQNFTPQYTTLDDFITWYRKLREEVDVVNEWRGAGDCGGLCKNIDVDLEAYEREEKKKKEANPEYVFGSHEDDQTRLTNLQARILYKYYMVELMKDTPEATAGTTDARSWLKKYLIQSFEKNPALPACPKDETDTNKLCHRSFVETNTDQATKNLINNLSQIGKGAMDKQIQKNPCNIHTLKARFGYTEPAPEGC